ncbi:MFS general substrate transporter [Thozetella sp. PMI_491]|nr:MFS general substrate transporter [Thozetella sp. PMI_491]
MTSHATTEQQSLNTAKVWGKQLSLRSFFDILTYTPQRCRYSATNESRFSFVLNLLFGLTSTVTAANLYYCYPILNKIADDFNISYEKATLIPTVLQAGYGSGILFLCPLGDRVRLRPFVLCLILLTAMVWTGLCLAESFELFCAFSFIAGFTTVTPQLMIPLASSLASPARRATAISIVFSGLMLGTLLPRVLSGILTQYTHWRVIYWAALGMQYFIFSLLWLFMPDYPSDDPGERGYLPMLWSIVRLIVKQPILAYGCLMVFFSNAAFSAYWTTLTALLSSPLYNYSSLQIGLFALIGIAPLLIVPTYSRVVIDRYVPNLSVGLGLLYAFIGIVIGTYTGILSISGVVIQALAIDFGVQTASIAYRSAIYSSAPSSRNRSNVAYTVAAFAGQLMGTSVGNHLYATGGWTCSGGANIGFILAALTVSLVRGPWETQWVGWRGGISILRKDLQFEQPLADLNDLRQTRLP